MCTCNVEMEGRPHTGSNLGWWKHLITPAQLRWMFLYYIDTICYYSIIILWVSDHDNQPEKKEEFVPIFYIQSVAKIKHMHHFNLQTWSRWLHEKHSCSSACFPPADALKSNRFYLFAQSSVFDAAVAPFLQQGASWWTLLSFPLHVVDIFFLIIITTIY